MSDTSRTTATLSDFNPKSRIGTIHADSGNIVFEVVSDNTPSVGDELYGNFRRLGSETYFNKTKNEGMRVLVQSAYG